MPEALLCPNCNAPLKLDEASGEPPIVTCHYCNSQVLVRELKAFITATDSSQAIKEQEALEEVLGLVNEGKKIEAIKLVRQLTGLGLKEAKDAVEAVERGEPLSPDLFNQKPIKQALGPTALDGETRKEVVRLADEGKKIEAIKLYRQQTGLGLKEAKDAVDEYLHNRSLEATTATSQATAAGKPLDAPGASGSPRTCIVFALAILLGVVLLAILLEVLPR